MAILRDFECSACNHQAEDFDDGDQPNICFIHPSMAAQDGENANEAEKFNAGDIEVHLTTSVLPHHFWIGKQLQN